MRAEDCVASGGTFGAGFEETLTEDQLLARIDTALVWSQRAWKLNAISEQVKATAAQVATWRQLAEYCDSIEQVSDMILRLKVMDKLASLKPKYKEELLREWASAEPDSYEGRKLGKCSGVISREPVLESPVLGSSHGNYSLQKRFRSFRLY